MKYPRPVCIFKKIFEKMVLKIYTVPLKRFGYLVILVITKFTFFLFFCDHTDIQRWKSFQDYDVYVINLHIFVISRKKPWSLKCKFNYWFSIALYIKKCFLLQEKKVFSGQSLLDNSMYLLHRDFPNAS